MGTKNTPSFSPPSDLHIPPSSTLFLHFSWLTKEAAKNVTSLTNYEDDYFGGRLQPQPPVLLAGRDLCPEI
jgi:hypothetical protein